MSDIVFPRLDHVEIGRRIATKRKAAGLTQQDVADRMQLHVNTYQKWETGERIRTFPRFLTLSSILGCSADDLLGIEDSRPIQHALNTRMDKDVLSAALQEMAQLAAERGRTADASFWAVMGEALFDILSLALRGDGALHAEHYLRGVLVGGAFVDPGATARKQS
jgi:transcriptional regulator with XRE-family HTH domain